MLDANWLSRITGAPALKQALKETPLTSDPEVDARINAIAERKMTQETRVVQQTSQPAPAVVTGINAAWPQTAEESGLLMDSSFVLDDSQKAAIKIITRAQYSSLIGAAGSGKTSLVKHILAKMIYGDEELGLKGIGIRELTGVQGPSIALCAFTGIASQVIRASLPDWLAPACKTIHTLLEYKPVTGEATGSNGEAVKSSMFMPTRGRGNQLDHDVIVVDEASMLGLDLWHNLLDAIRENTIIILIGDLNQLKPVADQTMFAYALADAVRPNGLWKLAELTTIHRQKEAAANRIIETAHAVLIGKTPKFDNMAENPNWRVVGFKLDTNAEKAHRQIVGIADKLRANTIKPEIDPTEPPYYNPYIDRIMTAGNGYDENDTSSMVQQAPLNGTLCRIFEPPSDDHPIYIIDAGISQKRFAVGHRVMATKNEAPSAKDRVTNGMTGRIQLIEPNSAWSGIRALVGPEKEVQVARAAMSRAALSGTRVAHDIDTTDFELTGFDLDAESKDDEGGFGGGPASHVVTVLFDNGATRIFRTKSQVGQLQLAYATTVHKAQGSQCDTAIIVCHQAVKSQLNREWLYTAITRAKKRVVLLYTDYGLSTAIAKQQIYGSTLGEKVGRYLKAMDGEKASLVRLVHEDADPIGWLESMPGNESMEGEADAA